VRINTSACERIRATSAACNGILFALHRPPLFGALAIAGRRPILQSPDKRRLIADLDPDEWDLPPKPKWMRWQTYRRYEAWFDRWGCLARSWGLSSGSAAHARLESRLISMQQFKLANISDCLHGKVTAEAVLRTRRRGPHAGVSSSRLVWRLPFGAVPAATFRQVDPAVILHTDDATVHEGPEPGVPVDRAFSPSVM
jgi:hypothetical protein